MKFARTHCGFNESQYSSMAGKQAQPAILNKILTYNYFPLTRENVATLEFDAQANYDRIIPALAVIVCQRLGLEQNTADLLYDSLTNLKHQVCTANGLSAEYGPTRDNSLFSKGQGSSGSPTFWAVIAEALFNAINLHGPGMILKNPGAPRPANGTTKTDYSTTPH